jgi:hypothetical protein
LIIGTSIIHTLFAIVVFWDIWTKIVAIPTSIEFVRLFAKKADKFNL